MEEYNCYYCKNKLEKPLTCSRCKNIYYCNTECQKSDYINHKKYCFIITSNDYEIINKSVYRMDNYLPFTFTAKGKIIINDNIFNGYNNKKPNCFIGDSCYYDDSTIIIKSSIKFHNWLFCIQENLKSEPLKNKNFIIAFFAKYTYIFEELSDNKEEGNDDFSIILIKWFYHNIISITNRYFYLKTNKNNLSKIDEIIYEDNTDNKEEEEEEEDKNKYNIEKLDNFSIFSE
jgi:hypothetical protein